MRRSPLTARLVILADVVAAYLATQGPAAAVRVARNGPGPSSTRIWLRSSAGTQASCSADLDAAANWDQIIDADPALDRVLRGDEIDAALAAIGDFADLKSPFTIGHSRRVAELAGPAAAALGLPDTRLVRRAGAGPRSGSPGGVQRRLGQTRSAHRGRDGTGPTASVSDRADAGSARRPGRLGTVAVQHHERLDGSGYPRGLRASSISAEGRVLAAADRYAALIEERPHRRPSGRPMRPRRLRGDVRSGRLDAPSVEAVLGVAGHGCLGAAAIRPD